MGRDTSVPVSEATIARVVDAFYAKVRRDPILGPVFAARIRDWGPHLALMKDFWSSVMRTTGRYKGNPILAHRRIAGIRPHHFARWLILFDATLAEQVDPATRVAFMQRAERMGATFQRGLAADNPVSPPL